MPDLQPPCGLTSRRSQPPLARSVPLSRFTSRVGGGSAFYVRRLYHSTTLFMSITGHQKVSPSCLFPSWSSSPLSQTRPFLESTFTTLKVGQSALVSGCHSIMTSSPIYASSRLTSRRRQPALAVSVVREGFINSRVVSRGCLSFFR